MTLKTMVTMAKVPYKINEKKRKRERDVGKE